MTIAVIDHPTEGLALLIEQYQNKPRIADLLTSYLDEIQELEVAMHEVLDGYNVDSAVGAQLDVLGRIVRQSRRGQTDESYRVFLRARIAANRSRGNSIDVRNVLSLATSSPDDGWDPEVELMRFPPNSLWVYIGGFSSGTAPAVAELLRDSVEANVAVDVLVTEDPDNAFRWDTGPGWDVGHFVFNV